MWGIFVDILRKIKTFAFIEILLALAVFSCAIGAIFSGRLEWRVLTRDEAHFKKQEVSFESILYKQEVVTEKNKNQRLSLPLFQFMSHEFTNCGAFEDDLPVHINCVQEYNQQWVTNDHFFRVYSGIQYWTVPESGNYQIIARGAQGGCVNGGAGAVLADEVWLERGARLALLIGQRGACSVLQGEAYYFGAGGGGGASYIVKNSEPILIAGGGGGGGGGKNEKILAGAAAILKRPTVSSLVNVKCGAARSGMMGGGGGGGANYGGGGGGGFHTDGGNFSYGSFDGWGGHGGTHNKAGGDGRGKFVCQGSGGQSFLDGGKAGIENNCVDLVRIAAGGFGGGGAGVHESSSGGGGGGWSGGAGGFISSFKSKYDCAWGVLNRAQGGSSYATQQSHAGLGKNFGDGSIFIRKLGALKYSSN